MAEYTVLLGVSLAVFLALFAAFDAAARTAGSDASALAAENVASGVSEAICEAVGDGSAAATVELRLPEEICGKPYLVYPDADNRHLLVCVAQSHENRVYSVPLFPGKEGIRIVGFLVSGPDRQVVTFDPGTGTVTIS